MVNRPGVVRGAVFAFLIVFTFVVSFSAARVGFGLLDRVGSGVIGVATRVELPVSANTPYPYEGEYVRLTVVEDGSVLDQLQKDLGLLGGGRAVPLAPGEIADGSVREPGASRGYPRSSQAGENRHVDTWLSQTTAFTAALRAVTYDFGTGSPAVVKYGDTYIVAEEDGGGYRRDDVIVVGDGARRLLRDSHVVGAAPDADPPRSHTLYEYPQVPRAFVDENLTGSSAGLLYALQYVDAMAPGSLLGGRSVAATGTISLSKKVGPVGSVDAKIRAAAEENVDLVLIPEGNADSDPSLLSIPDAPRVVPVGSLTDAVREICQVFQSEDDVCEGVGGESSASAG